MPRVPDLEAITVMRLWSGFKVTYDPLWMLWPRPDPGRSVGQHWHRQALIAAEQHRTADGGAGGASRDLDQKVLAENSFWSRSKAAKLRKFGCRQGCLLDEVFG
jgi:hypothetical protein